MNHQIIKRNAINIFENQISKFAYYGIFFDGKMVCITRARVYLQHNRAVSEIISQNMHVFTYGTTYDNTMKYTDKVKLKSRDIKKVITELITEGRLQIKIIQ